MSWSCSSCKLHFSKSELNELQIHFKTSFEL